jgi:hypothetical protein
MGGAGRSEPGDQRSTAARRDGDARATGRAIASSAITLLACLFGWAALTAADPINRHALPALVRIPLEGLLVVATLLVLPRVARAWVAVLGGVAIALVAIAKILDTAFFAALGRPFNPVSDGSYFRPAVGVLEDSIGRPGAVLSTVGAVLLGLALLVLLPMCMLRVSRAVHRHRRAAARVVAALLVAWTVCALASVRIAPSLPVASTDAARLAADRFAQMGAGLADRRAYARAEAVDPLRGTPGGQLLTALRGKNVLLVFVESYGRVAVQDSPESPRVDALLDDGTKRLQAAGFSARSAFLTSPTFGGISWLAHSTLQSGLWINNQGRYDDLLSNGRFTLTQAFSRAGWRTVADVPSNERDWPEGKAFYHYDQIYDSRNVGYAGPRFSYSDVPDQYVMARFRRDELARPHHTPVMAEIDLSSSHGPWAPLPHMIGWDQIGDGSVYDAMAANGETPDALFKSVDKVRAAYGQSIEYSLTTLITFVEKYGDPNLVMVLLGDHQPATVVSGENASRDVPITFIAHDEAVMNRISGWGWEQGMRPSPTAPVWRMDAFRDRFLSAFGPR